MTRADVRTPPLGENQKPQALDNPLGGGYRPHNEASQRRVLEWGSEFGRCSSCQVAFFFCTATLISLLAVEVVSAQQGYQQTKSVDKSGNADATSIGAALTAIGDDPEDRWTVLIYAGTYQESVALGAGQENIDLIGVDPGAVIIAPSSGNGVTITTGDETARNNSIRNLTIQTTSGHGIEIIRGSVPGDNAPKNITIEGVTISAAGSDKHGITAPEVVNLGISNCRIASAGGHGVSLVKPAEGSAPTSITITACAIGSSAPNAHAVFGNSFVGMGIVGSQLTSTQHDGAVFAGTPSDLVIRGCSVTAVGRGLVVTPVVDTTVSETVIQSTGYGIETSEVTGSFRVSNSSITTSATSSASVYALRLDNSSVTHVFESCRLEAINDGTGLAAVTLCDAAPVLLDECQIIARNTSTAATGGPAVAIDFNGSVGDPYTLVGGSIVTTAANERQTRVYDIDVDSDGANLLVSGTQFTKWRGPILPVYTPRAVTQNFLAVSNSDDDAIHGTIELSIGEQEITTNITNPDVYRVLKVVGSGTFDDDATFYIIGTNWAGADITDAVTLAAGTNPSKVGAKPFKAVTKLIIPSTQQEPRPSVTFGTTNLLGLSDPIGTASDVLEWSKLTGGAGNSYVVQDRSSLDGQINVELGEANTIDLPSSPGGASFTFTYLTP
jgi:hypothetical protein